MPDLVVFVSVMLLRTAYPLGVQGRKVPCFIAVENEEEEGIWPEGWFGAHGTHGDTAALLSQLCLVTAAACRY